MRPELSLARITQAGLSVGDAGGLDNVSMANVAKVLECSPMAIYRHVSSKEELLVHLQDAAFGDPPADCPSPWQSGLHCWGMALVRAFAQRPWALQISVDTPPLLPRQLAWMEQGLALLQDSPLTIHERLIALQAVSGQARAHTLTWSAAAAEPFDYGRALLELIDPDTMPQLAELAHDIAGAPDVTEQSSDPPDSEANPPAPEATFEWILDRLIAGLNR